MKASNKSSSMPSLAYTAPERVMSTKPRKHKLQELENEVNKSRIAIVPYLLFRKTWVIQEHLKVPSTFESRNSRRNCTNAFYPSIVSPKKTKHLHLWPPFSKDKWVQFRLFRKHLLSLSRVVLKKRWKKWNMISNRSCTNTMKKLLKSICWRNKLMQLEIKELYIQICSIKLKRK